MQAIANFCQTVDHGFNVASRIPFVSMASAAARGSLWAPVKIVGGTVGEFVAFPLAMGARLIGEVDFSRQCVAWGRFSFNVAENGLLDFARASNEWVPIFGNLACYLWDKTLDGAMLVPYIPTVATFGS